MRICPKCKYVRQPTDDAPDWQCPSCHVAYAKALDAAMGREAVRPETGYVAKKETSSLRGVTLVLAILMIVALALYGKARKAKERPPYDPVVTAYATNTVRDADPGAQPVVILYATSWCGYCRAAREFFAANGIRYIEYDIEESESANEEYTKLGGRGVPFITVGDEKVRGFNRGSLTALLEPWMKT